MSDLSLAVSATSCGCGNAPTTAIIDGCVDGSKQAEELESCVLHKKEVVFTITRL